MRATTTVELHAINSYVCPSDPNKVRPYGVCASASYRGNHGGPGVMQNWTGTIVELATSNPASWWGTAGDPNMAFLGIEGVSDGPVQHGATPSSEKLMGVNTSTGAMSHQTVPTGLAGPLPVNYPGTYNTQNCPTPIADVVFAVDPHGSVDTGQPELPVRGGYWHRAPRWDGCSLPRRLYPFQYAERLLLHHFIRLGWRLKYLGRHERDDYPRPASIQAESTVRSPTAR